MDRKKNSLQRYVVVTPEMFDELKPFINFEKNLTSLDREIYKILSDKKMNNVEKWYRYRHSLAKQSELKRKKPNFPRSINSHREKQRKILPSYSVGTQTRYNGPPTLDKSTTTAFENDDMFIDDEIQDIVQENELSQKEDSLIDLGDEDIFETTNLVDDKHFDGLPRSAQQQLLKKLSKYERDPSLRSTIPVCISVEDDEGNVYGVPTNKDVPEKTPAKPKRARKITPRSPKRTRSYIRKMPQGSGQSEINFPVQKKLSWTPVP